MRCVIWDCPLLRLEFEHRIQYEFRDGRRMRVAHPFPAVSLGEYMNEDVSPKSTVHIWDRIYVRAARYKKASGETVLVYVPEGCNF